MVNRIHAWVVAHTKGGGGTKNLWDGLVRSRSRNRPLLRRGEEPMSQPISLPGGPLMWSDPQAAIVPGVAPEFACQARARHHSLHTGFDVSTTRDDLAVFSGGRRLRLTRFVAGRAGENGGGPMFGGA